MSNDLPALPGQPVHHGARSPEVVGRFIAPLRLDRMVGSGLDDRRPSRQRR